MASVRLVDLSKQYQRGREVIRALDGVTLSWTRPSRWRDSEPVAAGWPIIAPGLIQPRGVEALIESIRRALIYAA